MKDSIEFQYMRIIRSRRKFIPLFGLIVVLIVFTPCFIFFRPSQNDYSWGVLAICSISSFLFVIFLIWQWMLTRDTGKPVLLINKQGIYEHSNKRRFLPWIDIDSIRVDVVPNYAANKIGFEALFVKVKNQKYVNKGVRIFCSCVKWLFVIISIAMVVGVIIALTHHSTLPYAGFAGMIIFASAYSGCKVYLQKVKKDEVIVYLNNLEATPGTLNADKSKFEKINPKLSRETIEKLLMPKSRLGVVMK
jgi:hypothetical protein